MSLATVADWRVPLILEEMNRQTTSSPLSTKGLKYSWNWTGVIWAVWGSSSAAASFW